MENFHRHKWMVYAAIVLLSLLAGWFVITVISNAALDKNRERQQQIEVLRKEANARADSIDRLIVTEKDSQKKRTESLARRVETVKNTGATEKQALLKQYEKAFKDILLAGDDSIAVLDSCNRTKYIRSSPDTTLTGRESVQFNKQLRRDRVAMLLIIEQLETELAILETQVDSCDELVSEYQHEIDKCKSIYRNYDKLIEQKNAVHAIDAQQIKLLKREARLLKTKLIATGVVVPVASAGVASAVTFLFMSFRK